MAGGSDSIFYRNLNSSDTTNSILMASTTFPNAADISLWGWTNPGYVPKEWNTQRNGSGTSYALGASLSVQTSYFLIWEAEVVYTTTAGELTSIADAIRTKGGTSAPLEFPDGFVDAIEDIPTGTDTSDATAIASDILSGKTAYIATGKVTGTIASKSSSDLTSSGDTVSVPAGYYASAASKAVPAGSASTPATSVTANPSISVSSGGLITASVSASKSVTPSVSAGWVSSGTAGTVSVSGSNTQQLSTQAAQTITPGTTDQTIAAGKYLTGAQTIKGDANLVAANIAKDVSIFGVTGTHEGGGGGTDVEDAIIQGTLSGSYTNSRVSTIGTYAFYNCRNLTSVSFPSVETIGSSAFYRCESLIAASFPMAATIHIGAFENCTRLTAASFPSATSVAIAAFQACTSLATAYFPALTSVQSNTFTYCSKLLSVDFPLVTDVGQSAFYQCRNLTSVSFPLAQTFFNNAFGMCSSLQTISLPSAKSFSGAFRSCYRLTSLYLLGSSVASLTASAAFSSTPIAGYTTYTGGQYGSIYVPSSLYSTYVSSTNWAYFSSRFVSV